MFQNPGLAKTNYNPATVCLGNSEPVKLKETLKNILLLFIQITKTLGDKDHEKRLICTDLQYNTEQLKLPYMCIVMYMKPYTEVFSVKI